MLGGLIWVRRVGRGGWRERLARVQDQRLSSANTAGPATSIMYACRDWLRSLAGVFFGSTLPHMVLKSFEEMFPNLPYAYKR